MRTDRADTCHKFLRPKHIGYHYRPSRKQQLFVAIHFKPLVCASAATVCAILRSWRNAAMITAAQIPTGKVPHWERFLRRAEPHDTDYKIVIPSFDRPAELCGNTLTLLKSEGIDVDRVNIFVSPVTATNEKQPQR